jgi:hypothetical protein
MGTDLIRITATYDKVWALGDIIAGYQIGGNEMHFLIDSEVVQNTTCGGGQIDAELRVCFKTNIKHSLIFLDRLGNVNNICSIEEGTLEWFENDTAYLKEHGKEIFRRYGKVRILTDKRIGDVSVITLRTENENLYNGNERNVVDYYAEGIKTRKLVLANDNRCDPSSCLSLIRQYEKAVVLEMYGTCSSNRIHVTLLSKGAEGEDIIPDTLVIRKVMYKESYEEEYGKEADYRFEKMTRVK